MSFLVKVEGSESFEVAKECVRSVKVTTDIPLDSNARTKDVGATMVITGKILAALDGDITDSTRKLALWSVVPAEKVDCYRKVTVEHVAGGVMERKYCFPNAFVLDYKEEFGDVGTLFYAQLPQTRINTGIAQNLKTIKRIYNHT